MKAYSCPSSMLFAKEVLWQKMSGKKCGDPRCSFSPDFVLAHPLPKITTSYSLIRLRPNRYPTERGRFRRSLTPDIQEQPFELRKVMQGKAPIYEKLLWTIST